jgi:1-acyl-sn-glycerol-3-phosphate acyltransferase
MHDRADPVNSDSLAPDTWLVCWARRSVTLPLYALLTAAAWMALPLLVPIALIFDALYGRRWSTTRALLFFPFYLACECLGVAVSLLLWVEYRLRPSVDRSAFLDRNFRLQQLWAAALFEGARRLFGFRVELENFEEATRDLAAHPVVVFFRHASTVDTVLPAAYLSRAQGTRLRYVMKRELLWDPCLDIVGQRLPNIFLRRNAPDPKREIATVRRLGRDLGPGEGVLIYPEGTRFTPAKRERILDRMAQSDPRGLLPLAKELRHVLPPKLGGMLALLEQCKDADVLFFAHSGLENVASFREIARGVLTGRRIRLRLWRVPASEVPQDAESRITWFYEQWRVVDRWLGEAHA